MRIQEMPALILPLRVKCADAVADARHVLMAEPLGADRLGTSRIVRLAKAEAAEKGT